MGRQRDKGWLLMKKASLFNIACRLFNDLLAFGMFCTEDRPLLSSKMREIQIRPVPIANVSCHNEEVWDTRILLWQNVLQSSLLAFLALATLIANLIFVLVLRSNKYHKSVHVQVKLNI